MNKQARLRFLFNKYVERQCSSPELEELFRLLDECKSEDVLDEDLQLLWSETRKAGSPSHVDWQRMYENVVRKGIDTDKLIDNATSLKTNKPYLVATLVILTFIFLIFWMISRQAQKEMQMHHKEIPVLKNAK